MDPLRNPKDPLLGPLRGGPDLSLELFRALSREASGMPYEAVVNAASNLFINAVRQVAPDWRRAEVAFDEAFGRAKQVLKNHYDAGGRLKGVFPYDQVVLPSHLDIRNKSH